MLATETLVRKQYLIAPHQVEKVQRIAKKQKSSAANIVRMAIDAFNPDAPQELNEGELCSLVQQRVQEAIADTKNTRKRLQQTLELLEVQ